MKAMPNSLSLSRYGFSVSKRIGIAVVRNKVKRRLREILRSMQVKPGWDIIFIARPAAGMADYNSLRETAEKLLRQSGLLATRNEQSTLAQAKAHSKGEYL